MELLKTEFNILKFDWMYYFNESVMELLYTNNPPINISSQYNLRDATIKIESYIDTKLPISSQSKQRLKNKYIILLKALSNKDIKYLKEYIHITKCRFCQKMKKIQI